MVYFDNQATTPLDARVEEVLVAALRDVGNAGSEHHAGWNSARRLADARAQVAHFIRADAEEVYFTSGATEANNIGIFGGALGAPASRRRILVSAIEHKSVLEAAEATKRLGFSVELIDVSSGGIVDIDKLARKLADDVAIVGVMAVNNEIGTIQPIEDIGRLVRNCGAQFHIDATQAGAAIDIDVAQWQADTASLSSHKIYGPGGVGALFVASDAPWRPQPLTFGGGQEDGVRPGTVPTALCVAFAEATAILEREGAPERERVRLLRDKLARRLASIYPKVIVSGAHLRRHPGCLHVRFPGLDGSDLLLRLQPDLAASTGSACSSGVIGGSHVAAAIGYSSMEAKECLRFSLGRFSTEEEVRIAATLIESVIGSQCERNLDAA